LKGLIFFAVVGLLLVVVQCCVLGQIFPLEYKPDLTLLLVVWIGFKGDYVPGLFSVFFLGIVEDLLSGGPPGLFPVIYLVAFMFSTYISLNFDMESLGLSWSVTIPTCFISFCLVFVGRWLGGQIPFEPVIIKFVIVKTISTSLGLILLKPILDRSWKGYCGLIGAA
jgi:rod shape-determining protein MreD